MEKVCGAPSLVWRSTVPSFLARSLVRLVLVVPLLWVALAFAQPLDISTIWPIYGRDHAQEGVYGGTLRIPLSYFEPFDSLNIMADVKASNLMLFLYPRLMEDDALGGLPHCHICTSFRVASGGLTVTFEIRDGLRWSDGNPLTAHDVVLTSRLYGDPANETDFRQQVLVGDELVTYTALDDKTLLMHLPEPLSERAWKTLARLRVLPAHVFGPAYEAGGIAAVEALYPLGTETIVSAGAWRFGSYDPEEGLLLLENREGNWVTDAYGNKLPYVDRLHQFGVDGSSEADLLLGGRADLAIDVADGRLLKPLGEAGNRVVRLLSQSSLMDFLIPNLVHPDPQRRELMQARDFRSALSRLLDRQAFARDLYGDRAEPVFNWNNREGYGDLAYPRFSYDLVAAQALLEGLGLKRDTSRTICPGGCFTLPNGTPLILNVSHFDRDGINGGAAWVVEALRQGGLEVVDDPGPVNEIIDRVYFRNSETFREFDIFFDQRGGAIDGREFYSAVFGLGGDYRYWGIGPEPGQGPSDVQSWEVRLSELASISESETTLARRVAAMAEATVIFAEELPMIPIVQLSRFQAYAADLANTFDQVSTEYQYVYFGGPINQLLYFR
jgi:peptide/nickel transport system substrate-binding protein